MERNEQYEQGRLPGTSDREILEGFPKELLVEYREHLLERYSELERAIHTANDVLDGYGISTTIPEGC